MAKEVTSQHDWQKHLPEAFAYHQVITNDAGEPVDYLFLQANPAFEAMTGLKAEAIIGRRVTEVMPGIEFGDFDWIDTFGQVALTGESCQVQQHSKPLDRWYNVTVYSDEPGYFAVLFHDITKQKRDEEAMEQMMTFSQRFLETTNTPDWQEITEQMRSLTGAAYAAFNLFDDNGLDFTTKALAGVSDHLLKVASILGFNPLGKKWTHDPSRQAKIQQERLTTFESLEALAGKVLPTKAIRLLEKTFPIGQTAIVKIMKENQVMGDYTLFMPRGKPLAHPQLAVLYASQVALFMDKFRYEQDLHLQSRRLSESEKTYRAYVNHSPLAIFVTDKHGRYLRANPEACQLTGYTEDELKERTIHDLAPPGEIQQAKSGLGALTGRQTLSGEFIGLKKDGDQYCGRIHIAGINDNEFISFVEDTTEKVKQKEELTRRDQLLTKLSQQVPGAIYQYQLRPDGTSCFPYASDGIADVYEVTPEEMEKDAAIVFTRLHPEDLDRIVSSIHTSADTLGIWQEEYRVILPKGGLRWLRGVARPEGLEDGSVLWHGYIADISDRKQMEEQLQERELRLHIATEGANTGIWDWDMVNDEVVYSSQWKKMLGYEDHEIENSFRGWKNLWHPEDAASIEQAVEDHLAGRTEHYEIIHRCRHKEGDWRWIVTRGTLLKDSKHKPYRWVGTNVDITDLKNAEEKLLEFAGLLELKNLELDVVAHQAEQANQAKSQFLANMSHEIRTPLNGILGFLQLLEETNSSSQQTKYIDYMKTSSETLLTLINDILDLSKIESGKMELEEIPFDLCSTLEDAVLPQAHRAHSKGLELHLRLLPGLPCQVKGDPTRFRQIVTNLVSNAVKFTESGSVTVECTFLEETVVTITLQIQVKDTGIGIAEEVQKYLFEAFSQADPSNTRKYGGTGLGLTITKDLVHLMQGTITLESAPGEGSAFTITMTLEKDNSTASGETAPPLFAWNSLREAYENTGVKVLVVEDLAVNQALIAQMLHNRGFICHIAENGQEAVKACQQETYHLVLMDCQMPVMNGYEATRKIRQLPFIKQPRIVAMTAHAMKEDREKCLAAGMDAYLAKPLDFQQVNALLQESIPLTAQGMDLVLTKTDGFDRMRGNIPVAHNLYQRLRFDDRKWLHMANQCHRDIQVITQEIHNALQQGDSLLLEKTAHSCKGLFAVLKAAEGCDFARRLEQTAREQNLDKAREAAVQVERILEELAADFHRMKPFIEGKVSHKKQE